MSEGPPPLALLATYGVLGSLVSFLAGRHPGTLPESQDLVAEMFPSCMVVCFFLTTYSIFDVMACGLAKASYLYKDYKDWPSPIPEKAFLAERAQTNQVEQLPVFLTATLCFSALVNGKLGAGFAAIWVVIRRLYASRYRNSVGIPFDKKGLSAYTIPCYFILNIMLMTVVVHGFRWMWHNPY